MEIHILDGSRIHTKDQFWQEYVAVVQPHDAEHFGRNLDAFNDALWGGPGCPRDDFTLRILHSEQLSNAIGEKFLEDIREICAKSKCGTLELL